MGENDRSEDFDMVSLTILGGFVGQSLGLPNIKRGGLKIENCCGGHKIELYHCATTDVQRDVVSGF